MFMIQTKKYQKNITQVAATNATIALLAILFDLAYLDKRVFGQTENNLSIVGRAWQQFITGQQHVSPNIILAYVIEVTKLYVCVCVVRTVLLKPDFLPLCILLCINRPTVSM